MCPSQCFGYFIPKKNYLFSWNLSGCPIFVFAEYGNPTWKPTDILGVWFTWNYRAWEARTKWEGLVGWDTRWRERKTKEHWDTNHIRKVYILEVVPPIPTIPTDPKQSRDESASQDSQIPDAQKLLQKNKILYVKLKTFGVVMQ